MLLFVYDVFFVMVVYGCATLIVYELQALLYTRYQDVFETFDVDKWTYKVALG